MFKSINKRPIDVVIIPGSRHTNKEYWYPQLTEALKRNGLEVLYPKFPLLPKQNLANWNKTLAPYEDRFTDKTIFVGHSLGGRFLFNYLQSHKAGAAFFVSTPYIDQEGRKQFQSLQEKYLINNWDRLIGTFFEEQIDWEKIRKNVKKIHLFNSTQDLFIPDSHPREIQKMLGGEIHWVENGRHLDINLERITGLTETILETYKELHSSHPEGQTRRIEC